MWKAWTLLFLLSAAAWTQEAQLEGLNVDLATGKPLGGVQVRLFSTPMTVTEDGSFRFINLRPGRYRFVYGWRASVRSIRLGTVEMEGNLINLTNGTGGAPLTVVLGRAEGEITGIVRDEKGPVAGAPVGLVNTGISLTTSNATFGAVTGADGRFRLANVPAGKYVLFSPDENDRTLWAGNFEDYADVLAEVEVGMKGTIEKDLKRRLKR